MRINSARQLGQKLGQQQQQQQRLLVTDRQTERQAVAHTLANTFCCLTLFSMIFMIFTIAGVRSLSVSIFVSVCAWLRVCKINLEPCSEREIWQKSVKRKAECERMSYEREGEGERVKPSLAKMCLPDSAKAKKEKI